MQTQDISLDGQNDQAHRQASENPETLTEASACSVQRSCSALDSTVDIVLYGSSDKCWNCGKGECCNGSLESDAWEQANYCVFEWECPDCGYLQKSKYKINLRYSVAGTPLSHDWKGGELPQHTSIKRRNEIRFGSGPGLREGLI